MWASTTICSSLHCQSPIDNSKSAARSPMLINGFLPMIYEMKLHAHKWNSDLDWSMCRWFDMSPNCRRSSTRIFQDNRKIFLHQQTKILKHGAIAIHSLLDTSCVFQIGHLYHQHDQAAVGPAAGERTCPISISRMYHLVSLQMLYCTCEKVFRARSLLGTR